MADILPLQFAGAVLQGGGGGLWTSHKIPISYCTGQIDFYVTGWQTDQPSGALWQTRFQLTADLAGSGLAHIPPTTVTHPQTDTTEHDTAIASDLVGQHYVEFAVIGFGSSSFSFTANVRAVSTDLSCAYGTEARPDVGSLIWLTPGVLYSLAESNKSAWITPMLASLLGTTLNVLQLCSAGRPVMPIITQQDATDLSDPASFAAFSAAKDKMLEWVKWAIWPGFCQCVAAPPGSPDPCSPDYAVADKPGTIQPYTPPVFDNTALAGGLEQIEAKLDAVSIKLAYIENYVTLIQRQGVPFGSIPGALHTGLSGAGTLAVQGLLGVSIESTTIPAYLSGSMAPVNSYFRLGEIAFGTTDGWQRRQVITHNPHLILPIGGNVTVIAYRFVEGVVANILELVRES
jgi:hypothetical protein